MKQNLEKNVEKIVAITLSVGLVTMNVGSSQRKIAKPVSGSSLSQVSNMNTVNASSVDTLERSEFGPAQTQFYNDIYDSSNNVENSVEKEVFILDKKNADTNINIIRATEIDFDNIVSSPKQASENISIDDGDVCTSNIIDVYELDLSEENMEDLENKSEEQNIIINVEEAKGPELECNEIEEPVCLGSDLEEVTEQKNVEIVENIINTELDDVSENINEIEPEVIENVEIVVEQEPKLEQTVVEYEPEQNTNEEILEEIVIENPPQIVVTPFGTRIVVDESKQEEVTPENIEVINKSNQSDSLEGQVQEKVENADDIDTGVPETQNTQIVNYPNGTYPRVYQTLDDIPEEGVNGTPKSAISALVMAGVPLAVVLLSLGVVYYFK